MELIAKIIPLAVLAFVVSSMLAVGLGLTLTEIVTPLRSGRLLAAALGANFVLMPIAALAIASGLQLAEPLRIALLLLATAAGAPFLPKLVGVAKGDLARSVGVMVLLMVVTVGYMPLVLPLLLSGVSVDAAQIARSLVFLMLIPLAVGLAVRAKLTGLASSTRPWLDRISSLSLVVLIVALLLVNIVKVFGLFGTRGILASVVFVLAGYGLGWLVSGGPRGAKSVMALGTSQRNIAAALVVGGQNFEDPNVVLMVVVVAIVGLLLLMALAKREGARAAG